MEDEVLASLNRVYDGLNKKFGEAKTIQQQQEIAKQMEGAKSIRDGYVQRKKNDAKNEVFVKKAESAQRHNYMTPAQIAEQDKKIYEELKAERIAELRNQGYDDKALKQIGLGPEKKEPTPQEENDALKKMKAELEQIFNKNNEDEHSR